MEAIQQQMVEAKNNGRANSLKEVKIFAKSLALLRGCWKARLPKVGKFKGSTRYLIV